MYIKINIIHVNPYNKNILEKVDGFSQYDNSSGTIIR